MSFPRAAPRTPEPIGGTCAGCGQPGHRYGTTDRSHNYDSMACVNELRYQNERLRNGLRMVVDCHGHHCSRCTPFAIDALKDDTGA